MIQQGKSYCRCVECDAPVEHPRGRPVRCTDCVLHEAGEAALWLRLWFTGSETARIEAVS